jgi:high-affinity nickel permease
MDNKNFHRRTLGLSGVLVLGNIAIWVWAYLVFHDQPVLLGTAFLAYSFGLRHALDADHIAAIDNVTRKLVQSGGFLFGLGFETATEIALLQVSASSGAKGQSLMNVMVLPVLFAAGMTLVDSADGMIMAGAYNWAFINPIRKLYYNLTITFVSVVVGIVVGGIELTGLVKDKLNLDGGWFWFTIGVLQDNFGAIGLAIVGVFILTWLISAIVYRLKKLNFPE